MTLLFRFQHAPGLIQTSTMARKKAANGLSSSPIPAQGISLNPSELDRPTGPLSIIISPEDRYPVKVNNANITELKIACDDALKRVSTLLQSSNQETKSFAVSFAPGPVQADTFAHRCSASLGLGKRLCRGGDRLLWIRSRV